jgi:hypothetical protein
VLSLVTLRHDLSGVLAVDVDGQPPLYLDLFQRRPEFGGRTDLPIAGGPDDRIAVRLQVQPWHNAESQAGQVWIRELVVTKPDRSADAQP